MKIFRTAYREHQAGKSTVKCLFQGHKRMVEVGFELSYAGHNHSALTT